MQSLKSGAMSAFESLGGLGSCRPFGLFCDKDKKGFTPAEGATHADTSNSRRKAAFTLAEVLITLGIIGVVAAITLPTLINNYQKKVWVAQLQKTYSTLEQGFQLMLSTEGVSKISDTKAWAAKKNSGCYYVVYGWGQNCNSFYNELSKYFKFAGIENYGVQAKNLNGSNWTVSGAASQIFRPIMMSDGAMLFLWMDANTYSLNESACNTVKESGGHMCSAAFIILIDVNGRKSPNTVGRDIFYYRLSDEGRLYANGSKDIALYYSASGLPSEAPYWRNDTKQCGISDGGLAATTTGFGCTARIMENGWKMDY